MEGNLFSKLAMLLWIPLGLVLGSTLPARRAALTLLIGGILFLPERVVVETPGIPLDKQALSAIAAYLACLVAKPDPVTGPRNTPLPILLLVLLAIGALGTVLTNGESFRFGPVYIPGLALRNSVSAVVIDSTRIILPYYLGRSLVRTIEDLREVLKAIVFGALLYVPLILIEARLSPILHTRVYGFFQHDFLQAMREGGFRPFVFMSHGLAVAIFMSQAVLLAIGFTLHESGRATLPMKPRILVPLLAVSLVLCKSMGALVIALIGAPLLLFGSRRLQFRLATWVALVVLFYPLLRFFDWLPVDDIIAKVREIDDDRSRSLEFRFINEDLLLERAQQKWTFGWGIGGRNHVHGPDGRPLTVSDGEWIIQLGLGGAYRFLIVFGLLLHPIFALRRRLASAKLAPDREQLLASTALLLAFLCTDLIPNALFNVLPLFVAGAAMSVAEGLRKA